MQSGGRGMAVRSNGTGLRGEIADAVRLAAPVALAQVSQVTMHLVDTAFVAPMGAVPLGAVALGTSLFFAPSVLLMGTVSAVGPIVAQRHGANDRAGMRRMHRDGWWVGLVAGALGTLGLLWVAAHNGAFGVEPE